MLRYAITDGSAGSNPAFVLERIGRWLHVGIELIQIREKDLPARELVGLTRQALSLPNPWGTRFLVNDRSDVALACGAAGVHLRANSVPPAVLRKVLPPGFLIGVSCHNAEEVASVAGADLIVVAPVFPPRSKQGGLPTLGLEGLRSLCAQAAVPVLALGGITEANAASCLHAGAAGVAGISTFSSF